MRQPQKCATDKKCIILLDKIILADVIADTINFIHTGVRNKLNMKSKTAWFIKHDKRNLVLRLTITLHLCCTWGK